MRKTWYVDKNGLLTDADKCPLGFIDVNGDVYGQQNVSPFGDPTGMRIGLVDTSGDVYNQKKQHLGYVDLDGTIYISTHFPIGRVTPAGVVLKVSGLIIGSIDRDLHSKFNQKNWRPMLYRAAAAVLLLMDLELTILDYFE